MFKKWLVDECNIKLRDYKKLSDEEKLALYEDWVSSNYDEHKCPYCGTTMFCGSNVWDGKLSYVDFTMAMVAVPAGRLHFKQNKSIVPTIHVCSNCGFTGLFLSKEEQKLFKEICCDIDYHE